LTNVQNECTVGNSINVVQPGQSNMSIDLAIHRTESIMVTREEYEDFAVTRVQAQTLDGIVSIKFFAKLDLIPSFVSPANPRGSIEMEFSREDARVIMELIAVAGDQLEESDTAIADSLSRAFAFNLHEDEAA